MEDEKPELTLAEQLFPPQKKKKKTLHDPNGLGATTRELKLLAKLPEMLSGNKTLAQITIESGLARDTKNAGSTGQMVLTKLQNKFSKNDTLLDALNLHGASLDDAAKALGKMLTAKTITKVTPHKGNIEGTREVDDNRVISATAQFLIAAHGAMPEKKIVTETKTFEEKVTIVKQIKDNPELAMVIARKLTGKTEVTSE